MKNRYSNSGWGSKAFDKEYYHNGARGGFRNYEYNSKIQTEQLNIKFNLVQLSGIEYKKILFVGCAKGFEVKYWLSRGYDLMVLMYQNLQLIIVNLKSKIVAIFMMELICLDLKIINLI
jgi:hypothetical protein